MGLMMVTNVAKAETKSIVSTDSKSSVVATGGKSSAVSRDSKKCVVSPDGRLCVDIENVDGKVTYCVKYDGKTMLEPSAMGLKTDMGDFTQGLSLVDYKEKKIDTVYKMRGTKASSNHYVANVAELTMSAKSSDRKMTIEIHVSNNDIAYRYHLEGAKTTWKDEPRRATIFGEASSFNFPSKTTTFICPQIDGKHKGWMSTKPSYEEEYKADAPMNVKSQYGKGYTFPCLFHVADDGWVLVSETGVGSNYCGSHLSDFMAMTDSNESGTVAGEDGDEARNKAGKDGNEAKSKAGKDGNDARDKAGNAKTNAGNEAGGVAGGYKIAYPDKTEFQGLGSDVPAISLPGATPWRTITVGSTLKPIVETTISYDVVEEMYAPHEDYKPGKYTWSWLIWQDNSIVYEDQVHFIDVASEMGFEYCLVDGWWDTQIGYKKIEELSKYAQSKGVKLMMWYNSNGYANDAPQGPRNCMLTSVQREKEMAWLEKIGVKGIKVDFFAGDKQQTMQLYEDILSDANRHGIQVIFHGCTLPRGWERMYPNFVASEAVLASENVYFDERHAKAEGFELTMHPFCRNTVASMDWGGSIMNRYLSKDNKSRHRRYTSDTFEMASAIVNQTSIQCICMQKSNLEELQPFEIDFLKSVPVTWDETQYIDGYPTKYTVIARKNGEKWYVAGLNGESTAKTLTLNLPMFAGKEVTYYTDEAPKKGADTFLNPCKKTLKVDKKGVAKVTMQGMGGIIITE